MLEEKIKEVLLKVDPINFLEHEIKRVELEQEERRQTLLKLKSLEAERQKVLQQEGTKKAANPEINNSDPAKASYKKALKKFGHLNDSVYEKLKYEKGFRTNKEVDNWLRS